MEAEMDDHLGYEKSERSDNDDYRNGYKRKQVNSRYGSMEIEVPQDRKSTFEPQVVKKRQKDISDIDQKIISMYAKGMTTRQISETIEDIYGFETSESFISDVTDKILPQIEDWQNRPLDEVYPILYIDAIHYSVRDNGVIRKLAAYVILGINTEGKKEVLTISVGDNESAKYYRIGRKRRRKCCHRRCGLQGGLRIFQLKIEDYGRSRKNESGPVAPCPQAANQGGTATLRRTGLPVQQPAPEPRGGTQCDHPATVRPHGRHILHPQPVPLRFRVADFNRGGLYGEFQPHDPRRSTRDHRRPRIHRPQRGHLHRDARPAARPAQRGRHALTSYHHRRQRLDRRQLRGHAGGNDR